MYIIHLKPDQPEALSVRIDEGGVGPQNGHQALYSHPTNLHGGAATPPLGVPLKFLIHL